MTELGLRDIAKRFGKVAALTEIDFTAPAGTRTAVVGPSGSGKSTLLRLIAGFEVPDAGEIRLDGALLADPRVSVPPHRRGVGLVMQDGALFPHLSVLDNIRFGMARGEDGARALEFMDLVELERGLASRQPHQLSGGQQQRVALARALVRRPRLMLLDEPFSALDSGLREQMRKATADILAATGVTTILVTHDRDEAMSFADQIVVLRDGVLHQAGPPREVYLAPADRETAAFLGDAIILDAMVAGRVATCSLGTVRVHGGRDGPASAMLRPEQIVLGRPGPSTVNGAHVLGRILATDFVGGSAVVTVAILHAEADPGAPDFKLTLRAPSFELPPTGSVVTVTIVGTAHVFPSI